MSKTKKITCIAMLCALSFVVVIFAKLVPISVVSFLKYDPKDIVIVISGFIFGPMSVFVISLAVSVLELFTISETGIIGLFMNIISSCSFACVASAIYKSNKSQKSAIIGLITGSIAATASMLVWNYLITPLYMDVPRAEVIKMLLPVFLPFNIIKTFLNSAVTLLIYKPFVNILRKAGIIENHSEKAHKFNTKVFVASVFTLVMCVASILILR